MITRETPLSRRAFMGSAATVGGLAFWNPWDTLTATADWVWEAAKTGTGWVWDGTKTGLGWVWNGSKWVVGGVASATAEVWDLIDPEDETVHVREDVIPYEYVLAGSGSAAVAGAVLNNFRHNLSWDNLPQDLKRKYLLAGGEWKGVPQAQLLYEQVPKAVRMGGPHAIWNFHKGKDWSHIVPKSMGGDVTQGVWWDSGKNRALGGNPMSSVQITDAYRVLTHTNVIASLRNTLTASVKGGMTGAAIAMIALSLEDGLAYAAEEISQDQLYERVASRAVRVGGPAFILSGAITGIALLFPAVLTVVAPVSQVLFWMGLGALGFDLKDEAKDLWDFAVTKI